MIKNLKKLLPLAGAFLGLITLFCCDSTLIEDLDAIARKQTEGIYTYYIYIYKENISDDDYKQENEFLWTFNEEQNLTQLKEKVLSAEGTTGFTVNEPVLEAVDDHSYKIEFYYKRNRYNLYFDANTNLAYEGTLPESLTEKYQKQITLELPELKLTGYMLLGWDENNNASFPGITENNCEYIFEKDTTLYAIWGTGNATYTVYHYLQGLGVDQDSYTDLLSKETAAGFAGDTTTATPFSFSDCEKYLNNITSTGTIEQKTIAENGTTEVFVNYYRNVFTIYLDLAGGIFDTETVAPTSPVGVDLVYGQDVAASITPFKRSGYTFTEWVPELPKTMEYTYKDITYEAQWDLIYYTIKYIVNGNETTATYTVESETITLPEPAETEGYSFEGWYKDPAFADGTKVEQIPQGSTGDLTLYAKWKPVIYTITYIVNGAEKTFEGYASKYTIETATITALPVPDETEGYSFEGWYKDPAFADESKVEQIPQGSTGNITLYAKMTETSSGIKYTTPAVSLIEVTITPTDDTFDTTTISDTGIKFQVDTDTLISSEQMTPTLTCQWYLDGIQQSTDPTDPTALNISYDSLTAGSHILTLIITDSTGKIATGTKQFVVIKN